MAYLIRHVSFTADHREIVRETRNDSVVLTVGRAAENDIAAWDLPEIEIAADDTQQDGEAGDTGGDRGPYSEWSDHQVPSIVTPVHRRG